MLRRGLLLLLPIMGMLVPPVTCVQSECEAATQAKRPAIKAPTVPVTGVVTSISSELALVLDGVHRVELLGVDAPKAIAHAEESGTILRGMVSGKMVRLERDASSSKGSFLTYVLLNDGTCINAEMIKRGYAFAAVYPQHKRMDEFRQLQREARDAGAGIWSKSRSSASTLPVEFPEDPTVAHVSKIGGDQYFHRRDCPRIYGDTLCIPKAQLLEREFKPCPLCQVGTPTSVREAITRERRKMSPETLQARARLQKLAKQDALESERRRGNATRDASLHLVGVAGAYPEAGQGKPTTASRTDEKERALLSVVERENDIFDKYRAMASHYDAQVEEYKQRAFALGPGPHGIPIANAWKEALGKAQAASDRASAALQRRDYARLELAKLYVKNGRVMDASTILAELEALWHGTELGIRASQQFQQLGSR